MVRVIYFSENCLVSGSYFVYTCKEGIRNNNKILFTPTTFKRMMFSVSVPTMPQRALAAMTSPTTIRRATGRDNWLFRSATCCLCNSTNTPMATKMMPTNCKINYSYYAEVLTNPISSSFIHN